MQVAPLVFRGIRRVPAHAPDPADHWQQCVAVFVEHTQPHRLGWRGSDHGAEVGGQFGFKLHGLGRIFFCMAFTRHFQFAAQAAAPLAHAAPAQATPGPILDPRLDVPRLPELSGFQPPDKLYAHRPTHRQPVPRRLGSLQQSGCPRLHHDVAVVEHALAAHVRHFGNLLAGQLVLRDQPHHQPPPPRPLLRRLCPRHFDRCHHFIA